MLQVIEAVIEASISKKLKTIDELLDITWAFTIVESTVVVFILTGSKFVWKLKNVLFPVAVLVTIQYT